jgi:hypothetical protein
MCLKRQNKTTKILAELLIGHFPKKRNLQRYRLSQLDRLHGIVTQKKDNTNHRHEDLTFHTEESG